MGDLIQKLPTDNVVMPPEEKDNFIMLFPDEPHELKSSPAEKTTTNYTPSTRKLKKEVFSLLMFIAIFFILNLPFVKKLIVEYIPLCGKSWIATNLVQAITFAFILWLVINSEYSRL
jgi:hypothetical protein